MLDSATPSRDKIILGKNSKYTQEQNIALSKQPNTKTPEQLVNENMAFVYHMVDREFSRYYKVVGIPREILVSAGMLGLVVAANKSKYGTFLRYAAFWIRYHIYNEIRNYFFIKRPASYCLRLNKIRKFQAKYKNSHDDQEPNLSQISKATGMPEEEIEEVLRFDEENSTSTTSYEGMQDDPDDKNKLDAVIESECTTIDIDYYEYRNLQKLVCHVLEGKQRDAVILRFFGHANNHHIRKILGIKMTEIDEIIEDGIKTIKEHVEAEHKWSSILEIPISDVPINVECDRRNDGVDFDVIVKNMVSQCPDGMFYEETKDY